MKEDDGCAAMRLLIQADVDGELGPSEAARVGAHLEACPDCAAVQAELLALSARLRRDVPRHMAPEALRAAVRARIAAAAAPPPVQQPQVQQLPRQQRLPWQHRLPGQHRLPRPRMRFAAPFGAGFALAACLALLLVLPPRTGGLADAVVADHIRALQPGHLMDVVSSDQHTVKPWFDGRLDYAPPVKDLKAQGFPLAGGRLDYLAGRPVAALAYKRDQHIINLYIWPDSGHGSPAAGSRNGYNFVRWNQDGMAFWAVSDLNAKELGDFVRLWRAG
jgi:anti-sigma factor RsiW